MTLQQSSPALVMAAPPARARPRRWGRVHRRFAVRLVLVLMIIGACLAAPLLTPFDPTEQQITARLKPAGTVLPNGRIALLGTDQLGRDIFTRILYGGRISLLISFSGVVLAAAIGITLGLLAGYFGKGVDTVISRAVDVTLGFPGLLLAITLAAALGPGILNVIIALGIAVSLVMLRAMAQRQRLMRSFIREQEAAEAYRSFVALASHQFRTPLAVIDSAMQRLLRSSGTMTHAEIEERANNVRAEVRGLNDLIGATLDVVRLDAGQVSPDPALCDIATLVGRVRERQLNATPDRMITVRVGNEVPPKLETDPLLAEQILGNLISNAIKYSPPSEPVTIHISAENRKILFAVEDRGIGIPEDEQENLFGRFFRASTARGIPGTGVGLSIAAQLARLLGGELEFVSRAGIGSIFVFKLPHEWAVRDAEADTNRAPA